MAAEDMLGRTPLHVQVREALRDADISPRSYVVGTSGVIYENITVTDENLGSADAIGKPIGRLSVVDSTQILAQEE